MLLFCEEHLPHGREKWQHKVRSMPKKKLPAIANSAVWNKVAKRSQKGMEGNGRKRRWHNVHGEVWGYNTGVKEIIERRDRRREKLALKTCGKERIFRDLREVKIRDWTETRLYTAQWSTRKR